MTRSSAASIVGIGTDGEIFDVENRIRSAPTLDPP